MSSVSRAMWRWMFVLSYVTTTVSENSSRVVRLAQGPVRGYRDLHGDIFSFYSIPYATGPTGPNKFKAPLPPPTWQKPFEAIDKGIICPQEKISSFVPDDKTIQEDCLITNIFVPDTNKTNLPVFIIIHGGGFQLGYGNSLKANNLIKTKDMIVVTFNHRLGKHGFLCLGTKNAPGNAGMKDQIALLRWVKNNIAAFGGNPSDVTVSGYSAGSSSTDLLILSRSTKGLFNKVIVGSGFNMASFSIQPDPLQVAKAFAKRLNFTNTQDINALEEFYTSAPLDQLVKAAIITEIDNSYHFAPCVEQDIGEEVFLDKDPLSILKSGDYEKVPMLLGFANMEGLYQVVLFNKWKDGMNKNFANYLPPDLLFKNEKEKHEVAIKIKEFYFGGQPVGKDNILTYIDYISDILYTAPALLAVKIHVENGHNEVYLYQYTFADENVPVVPHTNVRGAEHCAQMTAVLDGIGWNNLDESNITSEYKEVKLTMRELWSNFITSGTPVPESSSLPSWPAVGANWSPYMSLGKTLELKNGLLENRIRFWNDIYKQYYRTPVPPLTPHRNDEL